MLNPKVKFTITDYMLASESDNDRYELIDGELIMTPSPTVWHQRTVRTLSLQLESYLAGKALGEVYFAPLDVVLSDENVLQPDLMFISRERAGIIQENNIQGAPDLVIEILSPSTAEKDRVLKKNIYARFGVREYWIVDPGARLIEVYVARDAGLELVRRYPEGTSVSSTVLTDMHLDVSPVFA